MARNIEIKARIASVDSVLPAALECAGAPPQPIAQDDTFFNCPRGRLKLRAFADGSGELIAYERPDAEGPKVSDYALVPVADPNALRAALERSLGVHGRVIKQRLLLLAGATRIHLDRVEGLGDFLELEVVLRPEQSEAEGVAIAHALMARLGVEPANLVSGAYVDLLRSS